ncbi:MAG: bile acid:sodium symporter, partial [Rhodocyclaceae bacterium]|nr:bile acid:sodium symporter [Rhodocyclaceae bacterium]
MNTIFIVLPILTVLMFDLGLILKPADFRLFLHRPRPLLAGLVGQIILLPVIAWAVAWFFQPEPLFFIGFMLIACSPGGSSSNVFSMLARGDVALSVLLTAASSVITLFTVPLIMAWVTHAAGAQVGVRLPVGNLLVQNLL